MIKLSLSQILIKTEQKKAGTFANDEKEAQGHYQRMHLLICKSRNKEYVNIYTNYSFNCFEKKLA